MRRFFDEGPYKARVHAFFLAYHQVRAYRWWLSFHPTDLERCCEFEVSLEKGNVFCPFVDIFCSNGQKF
jgi:hypothetical protein